MTDRPRSLSTVRFPRILGNLTGQGGLGAPPIVLAAHGSRDPASSATMVRLAERVGRVWPAPVVAAFLDFDQPSIPDALRMLPPDPTPVVVPALLTHAYHGRVDIPAVLAAADVPTVLADVLGPDLPATAPDPLLMGALRRRLSELDTSFDGLVLLAAGTSHAPARSTVEAVGAELGRRLDVACVAGYASASPPSGGEAVAAVRATGARRIVAASYFLAPGRLYSAAAASARSAVLWDRPRRWVRQKSWCASLWTAMRPQAPRGRGLSRQQSRRPRPAPAPRPSRSARTPEPDFRARKRPRRASGAFSVGFRVVWVGKPCGGPTWPDSVSRTSVVQSEWARTRSPPRRLTVRRSSSLIPPQTPAS